jgi:hypothetical protein
MLILNKSSTDWQNQGISGEISRTQLPVAYFKVGVANQLHNP